MLALLGLLLGALLAVLVRPTLPIGATRYVAVLVVVALDASLGGLRAWVEQTFSDRVFVAAFVTNAALACGLVWVGDRLDADFLTALVVVFGIRIFQNLAGVRRRTLGG